MRKLSEMTRMVQTWNHMGDELIPALHLVLLSSPQWKTYQSSLLAHLYGGRLVDMPTIQQANTNSSQQHTIIGFLRQQQIQGYIHAQTHVLQGMTVPNIKDSEYKSKKTAFFRLAKLSACIFLIFVDQNNPQSLALHFLNQLEYSQNHSILIQIDKNPSYEDISRQILKKYTQIVRLQIVLSYRQMVKRRSELDRELQTFKELAKAFEQDEDGYAMKKHRQMALQLNASLQGTYVSQSKHQNLEINLRGAIFNILFQMWDTEYERISRSIQNMPMAEIEQQIKCYDSYSLGGFISSECFKAAFSNYLYEIREEVLVCLDKIHEKLTEGSVSTMYRHFRYLNFKESLKSYLVQFIQSCYKQFRKTFDLFLDSQISFISVSESDFWKMNTVNTSLYAKQILVELKYIGSNYVRKVIQGLKQWMPKMIGEMLIKKIVDGLSDSTFQEVRKHLGRNIIDVQENELKSLREAEAKREQIVKLVRYFCLKVESHNIIENLNEKIEKFINDRVDAQQTVEEEEEQPKQPPMTFMQKLRLIFGIRNNKPKRLTRSRSSERIDKEDIDMPETVVRQSNYEVIREAEWMIAINTNSVLPMQRMEQSARMGFPPFLRSSIWLYICRKQLPSVYELAQKIDKNSITYKQIMKDIRRTPPYDFFNGIGKDPLYTVLAGYSVYDPQVNYTQGMNFVVSMLLRVMLGYDESTSKYVESTKRNHRLAAQQSFKILSYVINELKWKEMYADSTPKLFTMCIELEDKITKYLPKLSNLFRDQGLNSSLIFTQGLMTIFSAKAPLPLAKRIFDVFLLKGDQSLLSMILKMLQLNQAHIMRIRQQQELFSFLRSELINHTYKHYPEIINEIVWPDFC